MLKDIVAGVVLVEPHFGREVDCYCFDYYASNYIYPSIVFYFILFPLFVCITMCVL